LTRLLSTGSINALKRTIELLRDVMDRDYNGVIKKKLDDVYRNTGNVGAAVRVEKAERENRLAFLVRPVGLQGSQLLTDPIQILLNDLDVSSSHLERLVKDLLTHPSVSQHYNDNEYPSVKRTVSSLSGLVPKFRSTLRVRRFPKSDDSPLTTTSRRE
jgi:conserved oligomeric Golgi complex subunit 4